MDTREAETLFQEAATLYKYRKYPEALQVLERLSGVYPNSARVMFPRARCLAHLGRLEEAEAICDKLIVEHAHPPARELKARIRSAESQGQKGGAHRAGHWHVEDTHHHETAHTHARRVVLVAIVSVLASVLAVGYILMYGSVERTSQVLPADRAADT